MNRKIGVILSYILMLFEIFSTLFLTPFIITTLGQAEYGVYKLVVAINAYLLLLDLGVGNAITRYIAKYRVENDREQERKFLGVTTIFYITIAGIALILGIVLVKIFPMVFAKGLTVKEVSLGQTLLCITMINSAITLGTVPFTNVLIAYEKFVISKGVLIVQIIIRVIFTFVVLNIGLGAVGIVIVNLVMTIICRLFFALYTVFNLRLVPLFRGIQGEFIKEIVSYSSLILLQMIGTQLNSSVDQILLGSFVESSSVILGIYGVGTQIVQYFQSMGSAFTGVLIPGIVKLVETNANPKRLTDEMIRIGRIILLVLAIVWSLFLVLGREFIVLWSGKENGDAYIVAIILISAYLITLTESVGSQILWAMNQHKEQAILKIVVVLLNIVLTIFLIKWNPLLGATIGTFISIIVGDVVVMNLIFYKKIKINLLYYYKNLVKGILPSAGISILIGAFIQHFTSNGWAMFILKVIIMILCYAISLLIFGMNSYEKNLCLSMLKILKRNKRA